MKQERLEALARGLRAGERPAGVEILKDSPVRLAATADAAFIKLFRRRPEVATREARNLERARARGLPVPEVLGYGDDWIALERLPEPREATRADLDSVLALTRRMHDAGMFHGDLHVGNLMLSGGRLWLLDLQRSRFLPRVPRFLRRWDLGFLAYSLGEPLPPQLAGARRARDRRAQRHWRSRTKRCCKESSGFTAWKLDGKRGFRARAVEPGTLADAVEQARARAPFKDGHNGTLWRHDGWVVKRHRSTREARRAWIGGHGLEMRGIPTGRAVGWAGRWLVMHDAGPTLIDRVEHDLSDVPDAQRRELAEALGDLLARLHRRGIYHADLKANNVAWTPGTGPRLIDYGRVSFGRGVARRRRVKNLAQLNAALPDSVDGALRERALDTYLARAETGDARENLRRDVIAESLRRAHRWSGCGPPQLLR